MPEKGEYVIFQDYERQIKSQFIIYADFESILLPENNGKQNRNESYTNKHQKHITCNYDYKLVCLDDKFSKSFKSYLGKDAVHNFINSMIKESKYSNEVMKKRFNKEIVMTKKDFKNSAICWICDNYYIDGDVKVRYCHIKGKHRGSAYRDCNTNLRLNHKISTVFHNLKNYDSHLIMQEIDKFNVKINVITNGLEKYISYTINNKLSATDSLQFRSSSSDCLVKNLNKDNFNYFSQKFDNNVLDLVKKKEFYYFEYMADFEKLKEKLRSKEKIYSYLTGKKIRYKEYDLVLNV